MASLFYITCLAGFLKVHLWLAEYSADCEDEGGEEEEGEEGGGGGQQGGAVASIPLADTVLDTYMMCSCPGEAGPVLQAASVGQEAAGTLHPAVTLDYLHCFPAECFML